MMRLLLIFGLVMLMPSCAPAVDCWKAERCFR